MLSLSVQDLPNQHRSAQTSTFDTDLTITTAIRKLERSVNQGYHRSESYANTIFILSTPVPMSQNNKTNSIKASIEADLQPAAEECKGVRSLSSCQLVGCTMTDVAHIQQPNNREKIQFPTTSPTSSAGSDSDEPSPEPRTERRLQDMIKRDPNGPGVIVSAPIRKVPRKTTTKGVRVRRAAGTFPTAQTEINEAPARRWLG